MAEIKHYRILEARSPSDLQGRVIKCIDAGFHPIGGVSVALYGARTIYCQAVVEYYHEDK